MLLCAISFIVVVTLNATANSFLHVVRQKEVARQQEVAPEQEIVPIKAIKSDFMTYNRLNIFSIMGKTSLTSRLKAIEISFESSLKNKWFGHGAGLSQKLLPEIANEYDRTVGDEKRALLKRWHVYGETGNKSLIDSHIFFLTEFFNVGLVGLIPLICLVIFVIVEQIRTIKVSRAENNNINELLFATLISMLCYRFAGSFIVIPFLWFILGLSFGVCKLYWKKVDRLP